MEVEEVAALNSFGCLELRFSKKESAPWTAAVASAQKQLHTKSRVHPALFLLSVAAWATKTGFKEADPGGQRDLRGGPRLVHEAQGDEGDEAESHEGHEGHEGYEVSVPRRCAARKRGFEVSSG